MKSLFLFVILMLSFNVICASAEKGYGFQVVNVAYPQIVRPSEDFLIDVTIHYWIGPYFRDKIQLQIRVYDYSSESTILIQNYAYEKYDVTGEDSYRLTLTAPDHSNLWRLSVRAYLVATHYDLSHAETDWYKDIEIQVSESAVQTMTTTYSTTTQASSTLAWTTYESLTQSSTVLTSDTENVNSFSFQNTYVIVAVVAAAIIILIMALSRSRRKTPFGVRYCVQCGIQLESNAQFCNRCGARQ